MAFDQKVFQFHFIYRGVFNVEATFISVVRIWHYHRFAAELRNIMASASECMSILKCEVITFLAWQTRSVLCLLKSTHY